jgi:hypothetical protein
MLPSGGTLGAPRVRSRRRPAKLPPGPFRHLVRREPVAHPPQRGAVAEQEDEEPHLDPEDRRRGESLHVGEEEQDSAQEGHGEADEDRGVHRVELREVHPPGFGVGA